MKRYLVPAILLVAVILLLKLGSCREVKETKQDVQQKAAIALADTQKVEAVKALRKVRHATDATLADPRPVLPKSEVKVIVDAERAACDTVRNADSAQVATRDTRVHTLEKRGGGTLFLYGDAGALARVTPPMQVRAFGEIGLAVSIDRTTRLNVGATTDQEVRVYIHREVKLF